MNKIDELTKRVLALTELVAKSSEIRTDMVVVLNDLLNRVDKLEERRTEEGY